MRAPRKAPTIRANTVAPNHSAKGCLPSSEQLLLPPPLLLSTQTGDCVFSHTSHHSLVDAKPPFSTTSRNSFRVHASPLQLESCTSTGSCRALPSSPSPSLKRTLTSISPDESTPEFEDDCSREVRNVKSRSAASASHLGQQRDQVLWDNAQSAA